ncbi:MAG: hypothetical protein WD492_16900 [Alkalispirochaeta sp.]
MSDEHGKLFLYEALELRGEFDGRIKTLKECLPDAQVGNDRLGMFARGGYEARSIPAPDVNIDAIREDIKALEFKRRKLNAAIQEANFKNTVTVEGETLTLAEALELRKATKDSIAELHHKATAAASVRVIHKEDRDITEDPPFPFSRTMKELEAARGTFRALNRALRDASFRIAIAFRDEPIGGT